MTNRLRETIAIHEKLRAEGTLVGGLTAPTAVALLPKITLDRWQVFRLKPSNTHHFCGWNMEESEGKVSSPILEYDKEARVGTTRSGRKYFLLADRDGHDSDAIYVLHSWLNLQGLTVADIEWVTEQY